MEIIDELEDKKRGLYGGTVGYLAFDGNIDTCIAIRTVLFKDGKGYVQAELELWLIQNRKKNTKRLKTKRWQSSMRLRRRQNYDFINRQLRFLYL